MPLTPSQALPSGDTLTDQFAREIALLLGPAFQPVDGSLLAEDLRVLGGGLAQAHETVTRTVAQAFADTATDLLPEWETRLELPPIPGQSTAARQAALTAKRRARGSTPARVLAAARAFDPGATLITNAIDDVRDTHPRAVFRYAVHVANAVWGDVASRARLRLVLDQAAPAYAEVTLGGSDGFFFGVSQFGRDLFGG